MSPEVQEVPGGPHGFSDPGNRIAASVEPHNPIIGLLTKNNLNNKLHVFDAKIRCSDLSRCPQGGFRRVEFDKDHQILQGA